MAQVSWNPKLSRILGGALGGAVGIALALHLSVEVPPKSPPATGPGLARAHEPPPPSDARAPFGVEVINVVDERGELEYRLGVTNGFADPDVLRPNPNGTVAAFKFSYFVACEPGLSVREPGFCDGLVREVAETEVFELEPAETTSERIELPAALMDGYYVLQVVVAGSSGAHGDSAVLSHSSHFQSREGRASAITKNQYYANSSANVFQAAGRDSIVAVRPVNIDRMDPTHTLEVQQ